MPPIAPSLPLPNPTTSYWHHTTSNFPHLNSNSDVPPPAHSQYTIIGSGLSGALTAYSLLTSGIRGSSVILLEARTACSGATSRNAGHVRPDAFRGFRHYASLHGAEQALKILADERSVLGSVERFVVEQGVDCDFVMGKTMDVCMNEEFASYQRESLEAYKKAGGDVSHVRVWEGEEAAVKSRVQGAVAAFEWDAGSVHPGKLVHWLLNACVERGVCLFTHCPVTKVERGGDGGWNVVTERGTVRSEHVVHCTNAYAALLLPQLEEYLTPNRAQAHSLKPLLAFSNGNELQRTLSVRYSLQHFYSVIQRKDGTVILGVSRLNPTLSERTRKEVVSWDDRDVSREIVKDASRKWDEMFPETKDEVQGERVDCAWTGIIGITSDGVPFVGPIDGMDGQWICAGFGGHGMARTFTCAPGLANLILGKSWSDTGLPECFQLTKGRLSKIQQKATAGQ